jgi:hypothetical protein
LVEGGGSVGGGDWIHGDAAMGGAQLGSFVLMNSIQQFLFTMTLPLDTAWVIHVHLQNKTHGLVPLFIIPCFVFSSLAHPSASLSFK